MKTIKADLHFHGPWAWYKENPREGPRTLENFADHLFNSGLDTVAYTNFVASQATEVVQGKQGFFHRFILRTVRDTKEYDFEVKDYGFNVDIYRKSSSDKKRITLTQEVQTSQGHLLAIRALEHIKPFRTAEETARQIINTRGIVVADHPTVAGGLDERTIRELAEKNLVNALEINMALPFHLTRSYKKVVQLARETSLPLIRNSDGHSWKELDNNKATTYGYNLLLTSKHQDDMQIIIEAINSGNTFSSEGLCLDSISVPEISIRQHVGRLARAVKHHYKTTGLPKRFLGRKIAGWIGCNAED